MSTVTCVTGIALISPVSPRSLLCWNASPPSPLWQSRAFDGAQAHGNITLQGIIQCYTNVTRPLRFGLVAVAQLTSEKAVAEAYAGELKTALEEAYEYIEQLEEERSVIFRPLQLLLFSNAMFSKILNYNVEGRW